LIDPPILVEAIFFTSKVSISTTLIDPGSVKEVNLKIKYLPDALPRADPIPGS